MTRTLLIGAGLAVLLALSHTILRQAAGRGANPDALALLRSHWPHLLGAVSIYGVVFVLYFIALRTEKMSLLYPAYTGLSVVLVAASGALLFGEAVSATQVVGIVLVAAGIVALGS